MADRPIVIIDTSVFLQDALSKERKGAASQLLAILPAIAHVVTCDEMCDELFDKLEAFGWTRAQVLESYGPVLEAAIWVEPVEEGEHHRRVVNHDEGDTVFVRTAEAVFIDAPHIIGEQRRFVISSNTRHFRPGTVYAGFLFGTPHDVLKALKA